MLGREGNTIEGKDDGNSSDDHIMPVEGLDAGEMKMKA